MRTLKLRVQYLGTAYRGWQIQPDQPTVQGCLETALSRLFGEGVRVAGAGRTDAGVHARGQVASFRIVSRIPCLGILRGANHFLPGDIRIVSVEEAPEGFHARHHAVRKDYAYRFSQAPVLSPFLSATVESIRGKLDLSRMESAAAHFLGRHDFTAFCGSEGRRRNAVRTVVEARFACEPDEVAVFRISADGFLQYLVRTIVGTLIEVGRGRIAAEAIPEILDARDRTRAGPTAAAKGLTLEKVHFPAGM
ncbi:MAG TPA: tRNA pseudouridine(38-40) synthase TruA [Candidatus Polarisedimenticolia bacterium]|nr:tRNA pseudouridine(38-40) synthase TruA [Candidatus Polarisedimenticolia bacterium]